LENALLRARVGTKTRVPASSPEDPFVFAADIFNVIQILVIRNNRLY